MQIYVFKNNQRTGPFTLEQVQANLKGGIFNSADLCWYDGLPNWSPVSTLPDCAPPAPPFPPGMPPIASVPPQPTTAATPPAPPAATKPILDESIGTALVIIPVVSAALTWFWIGNTRLIDGPGSKLGLLSAVTLLLTATLVSVEAGRLGFGADLSRPRSERDSPIVWFFGMVLVWFISYPRYLYQRSLYGARNLIGAGLFSMALWLVSLGIVSYSIATAQEKVGRQIQQLERDR